MSTSTAAQVVHIPVGDVVTDFADAAEHRPDRPAIVHNGICTTYRDLESRVDAVASTYRALRSESGRGARFGVLVSHTPAVVDHLLGVLQAGAIYCPIDATLPGARREALAEALSVDHLVAAVQDQREQTSLPAHAPAGWHHEDPAYVLCTSGSTGAPKPVVVSRRALHVTVRSLRELFALTHEDRVLQFASLGWDTCFEEILPALTAGAAVVFDDAAHSGSLPSFVRMIAEQEITVIDLPTAFWHELVLFLHEEKVGLPDSLRLLVIGGERVDPTRLQQWRGLDVGHIRLLNTYGCTETTMVTHAAVLSGPDTEPEALARECEAPIGRALAHVDEHLTADGELLIAGPSLATGYQGLPEATVRAFPVADHGGGPTRWFHTGDLVQRGENGLLYSRGRTDEQVKVLGVRVHPAEVETQLNTHPAVTGAVVVGERRLGRTSLTAYVVAAAATTPGELQRHLRQRLPSQFVPSRVVFVAALAHTASGKVDRAATQRASEVHHSNGGSR